MKVRQGHLGLKETDKKQVLLSRHGVLFQSSTVFDSLEYCGPPNDDDRCDSHRLCKTLLNLRSRAAEILQLNSPESPLSAHYSDGKLRPEPRKEGKNIQQVM